jgi:hypothetical protein
MTYQEYCLQVFREDHDCKGMSTEEIEDIIEENSFRSIEKYLIKEGYNLQEMYESDCD